MNRKITDSSVPELINAVDDALLYIVDVLDLSEDVAGTSKKIKKSNLLKDKADLVDGKVPSVQLPSYVIEVENFESLPITGENGRIYVTIDNNKLFIWTGSVYVEASQGITDHTQLSNIGINTHAQIDTALSRLANTSGTNTGDQDLSGLATIANLDLKANQDGTILYHSVKWFTPTGAVSNVGATVTSGAGQFTSAMVGAKLIINDEQRIITAFTSSTVVVVDSAYSVDNTGVVAGSWGVYSKASQVNNDGTIQTFSKNVPITTVDTEQKQFVLNSQNSATNNSDFIFKTVVDPLNTAKEALSISPSISAVRMFIGAAGKTFASLNLANVTALESVPVFFTTDIFHHGYSVSASFGIGRSGNVSYLYGSGNGANGLAIGFLGGPVFGNKNTLCEIFNNGNLRVVNRLLINTTIDNGVEQLQVNGSILGNAIKLTALPDSTGDLLFTKMLTAKTDGTVGWEDKPPSVGLQLFSYSVEGGLIKKTLTIPSGVTTISNNAFNSNQINSVTIPNSVTSIGFDAFGYNLLTSVTIPNSVTSIGVAAFSNNQLTSVTIPNSVTSIGFAAFSNNQLTTVTIPNSVTSIGFEAFYNNQLTAVTLPAGCTYYSNSFDAGVTITGGILI